MPIIATLENLLSVFENIFSVEVVQVSENGKKVVFEMTPSAKISLLSILLFEKELSDHYQHSNNSENTPLSLIHTQRYTEPLLLNTDSRSVLLLQDILGWIANAPYTHPGVRRCCCCCV